jgi:CubicO group peptidase (beta-lactamase class C family)
LLIIKTGKLVAEEYFDDGSVDLKSNLQSVGKSYTSALVGLAFDQGCLTNLDQPLSARWLAAAVVVLRHAKRRGDSDS